VEDSGENILWDISSHGYSAIHFVGEQTQNTLNESDQTQLFLGNPIHRERESSEILKIYLQNLGYFSKKKRRRCISRNLGNRQDLV